MKTHLISKSVSLISLACKLEKIQPLGGFFFFFLQFLSQSHLGNFVNLFIVCFWVILLSGKMMYLMRLVVVASQPHLGNFVYLLIVCVFMANFVEW